MENCPDYMAIWLGLSRIGVTVSLLNTILTGELLAHAIRVVAPRCVLVGAALSAALEAARARLPSTLGCWAHGAGDADLPRLDLEAARMPADRLSDSEAPAPSLEDRALFIYTSGTTGLPKAANVSHFRLMQWTHWFAGLMDTAPSDRMYNCLPMYHSIGGVVASGAPLVGGGAVVPRGRVSAREFWHGIVQGRCLRCAPDEVGEAIGALSRPGGQDGGRFEGYADAEASQQKILRDVFAEGDAWYRTGDLMRQDDQGFFYFVDRVGDTFRWKGENVSTGEVAAVISACPGVSDAAVYGVAVPGTEGRAGMAAIVVEARFEPAALRPHLQALPAYARPLFIRIVPSIELTGTFRLKKNELAPQGYDPAPVSDPLYLLEPAL